MSALERHLPGNDNFRRFPAAASPVSLQETGLDADFLLDLVLKAALQGPISRTRAVSEALKLPARVISQILTLGVAEGVLDQKGPDSAGADSDTRYILTDKGRRQAQSTLKNCGWSGPAPVPMQSYVRVMSMQSLRGETLTGERLEEVFGGLIIPDALMRKLGPAADKATAMMIYGPQGSGRTSIAAALCEAYQDLILVPHAVMIEDRVIRVFDPDLHEPVTDGNEAVMGLQNALSFDQRYVLCKRPGLIVGKELTRDMLELRRDPESGFYSAPLQMKANGGVLVLDDLGKGRERSQEIVNRLLAPVETRIDKLTFEEGHQVSVPLEVLVVFISHTKHGDPDADTGLKHLPYQIALESPDRETFARIFRSAAKTHRLTIDDNLLDFILVDLYLATGRSYRAADPKCLINRALSICAQEEYEPVLTRDLLARAWHHLPDSTHPSIGC